MKPRAIWAGLLIASVLTLGATLTPSILNPPGSVNLPAGSATVPSLSTSGNGTTGLFFPTANHVAITTGGVERTRIHAAGLVGAWIAQRHTIAIASDGINNQANAETLDLRGVSYAEVTCNDVHGCQITLSENEMVAGQVIVIVNISTNSLHFATSTGVQQFSASFAAGQYDTLTVLYASDRWVELARSNN